MIERRSPMQTILGANDVIGRELSLHLSPVFNPHSTSKSFTKSACTRRSHLRITRGQAAPRWLLRMMGIFVPVVRESIEMLYQFEDDYRFDSSKAEQAFGLTATTYREGLAATLQA